MNQIVIKTDSMLMHFSALDIIFFEEGKIIIDIGKHNVTSILARLKDELNLQKDIDLAEFLGVAQNTISAWKKRESVNYKLIFDKIAPYNIDLNWLIYGKDTSQPPESEVKLFENIKEIRQIMNLTEAEENVIKVIEIVQRLPWSTSTRRILMENYLYLVYKEQVDQSRKSS